ncbi:hypothetical protein PG991_013493 [Apiospora marii]|uniref:F-box domain-containing protein n=1 Tax=Apiospora marii TaxID=335849 RepID=A0ABR1R671_9PEZI
MPSLMDLPLELLRSIHGMLLTRQDIFTMTYTCKTLYKDLGGIQNMLQHDALQQRAEAAMVVMGEGERHEQMPAPLLLVVIRNGSSLPIVELACTVFHDSFPDCMDGRWGSEDEELVAPAFVAAQHGRLDIIQYMAQNGIRLDTTMTNRQRWHDLIICGEGLWEPSRNSVGDLVLLPSINEMIQYVPGVLMHAFYGASEQTASLLIQHFDLYTKFITQGDNVNMGVFGGLCFMAARLNMPQLLGHLLGWGVNTWAQRAGLATPEEWLNVLYGVAAEGTRHLLMPQRLSGQRRRTEDDHSEVLELINDERERVLGQQNFVIGRRNLLAAIRHNSPRNAFHILRKMVTYGISGLTQNSILQILQESLSRCGQDAAWLDFIRQLHPRHTSWMQAVYDADKANNRPAPGATGPHVEDHVPDIPSRMLSLAIAAGTAVRDIEVPYPHNASFEKATFYLDCAKYLLESGAVPDEDHVRHVLSLAIYYQDFLIGAEELSGLIDSLVYNGLYLIPRQTRRAAYRPWWDGQNPRVVTNTLLVMPQYHVTQPRSILELAMTQCLEPHDHYMPLNFERRPLHLEQRLLRRALPFCRLVYQFLAQGGRLDIDADHNNNTYRLVRLGLAFFRPGREYQVRQSEDVDGFDWFQPYRPEAKSWEVKWDPQLEEDFGMANPGTQYVRAARAGLWQPDPAVLTGRGANVHEQVLTAVCLLLGTENFFLLAEEWCTLVREDWHQSIPGAWMARYRRSYPHAPFDGLFAWSRVSRPYLR